MDSNPAFLQRPRLPPHPHHLVLNRQVILQLLSQEYQIQTLSTRAICPPWFFLCSFFAIRLAIMRQEPGLRLRLCLFQKEPLPQIMAFADCTHMIGVALPLHLPLQFLAWWYQQKFLLEPHPFSLLIAHRPRRRIGILPLPSPADQLAHSFSLHSAFDNLTDHLLLHNEDRPPTHLADQPP